MFTRSIIAITLGLLVATPALAADQQEQPVPVRAACSGTQQAGCMIVMVPGGSIMTDHGSDAGEAYDADGNPVDRLHNVVAVPDRRSEPREVFTTPVGVRF